MGSCCKYKPAIMSVEPNPSMMSNPPPVPGTPLKSGALRNPGSGYKETSLPPVADC